MKKGVKFLIFFILIALIWIIFLLLFKSRITGYSINAKNFYLVGENLEGFYNLKLRQGELWPLDAKVVVKANNITKELSLRDWLEQSGIDYEIIYGNFYVYDKNIYGYGEGFGKIGKYIEKPNIKFEIKIYSKEKEEKPIEEEHPVEIKPEIPVEQPAPIEQPQETVEQPQEEIPSQTEQPTEVEQPVEQPQLPPEEAETPAVPEQPSEQPEKPEAEKVQEGIFSRLIKYGPLNFFYLFRNLVGFAITNEIEGEKIIQAYVNIDNPYILEINENQYAEFVSGSVKINDIPADDNFIKFEKKDNKIIVTTDYKIEREGFGKEFLGEEFYINLSLNIFNLTFDKEGVYDLDVEIIYNNIILDKASAKIFVEKSNQTYYIIKLIDEKGRVIKEINISKNETREGIKLKIKEEKIILEKPEEIKVLSLIPFVKAQLPTSRLPVCGNNECESGEDTSNCPSDCPFTIYNYRGGDISVQFISPSQELINKGILTEIVYSTPADFDYALIKLNKIDPSLEISKILKCENWNAINTSCVGNFIPVDIPFVDYGDYIVINITNFSAYAGGAGYNASLVIWDSSDARAIGIKETIFFYANYSTYPDGIPINDSNGICLAFFSFENRPGFFSEMQFNYSSMLWETSFLTTEDMVGINNFTVNCSSSNYDNLTASDEFIIQNISVNIITNCTEINQSGIYKLNSNLTATLSSSFDGACIKIASDNVIFDCNNYAIINDLTDPTPYIITILKRTPSGLETGYNVSIKNCEIYNVYGNGIEINTFNNVNLENIKILKQERDYCWSLEVCGGIDIYDSNNISINNYYYEGSGIFGLRISNSSYLIARNIDIINHGYEVVTGECIYANMLNNSIFDEGFLNCSINLRLNGGSNINISNFYITNSYVRVTGGNIIIENNTFEDIYSFGAIDFLDSENIFIRNNIFKNVKGEYIKVDSSNNFEIYNNTFYYNSSEGLSNIIYSSASNNGIIKDNKFIYDDFTDYSQPLNNSSFIGISNSNNEIIKFENNYFKWEENEFYFDALIINTTSIYAYKGSPPSSPNNLIPLNKSLIIYQYSYNNRIDLNISFDPIYSNISYYKIDLLNDSGWIQQYTEIINNKAYTYFETPALNETYVFLSLFGEAPAECTCNSCKDCMDKLNDPSCTEVKLINDIINHTGTCINNPANFSNKVFDCQGHNIDGDDSEENFGIYLYGKQNNTIKNCIITDFSYGIYLSSSSNNILTNNTASSNNVDGIYLHNSSNNSLINNTANSNIGIGIYLAYSNNNTLINNKARYNHHGIYLDFSPNTLMRNNTINNNKYNLGLGFVDISHFYQDIDTSNTVDGKPIYYWTNEKNAPNNCKNAEINESSNAGFVALVGCDNITVRNLNLSNNSQGILLVNTNHSLISNNSVNSTWRGGIVLFISSDNILINNSVTLSETYGIRIRENSNRNTLNFNKVCNNMVGDIYLESGYGNIGSNNTCDKTLGWNDAGKTGCTYPCPIAVECTCNSCEDCTNKLNNENCTKVKLINDIINHTGTCINNPSNFSNKVFDCQGYRIDGDDSGTDYGIYLHSKQNNTIKNCIITDFYYGIYLWDSSNNTLTNNTVSSNYYGIYLWDSSNNILRNNNLIKNTYNFNIYRTILENYYHDIDTSNKVDGRPILYLTNKTSSCENIIIDKNYPGGEPGFVGLVGCNNITVKDLDLYNNRYGIMLVATSNSFIYNNSVHNNIDGIWLHLASNNNTISNNIVFYQEGYGIRIGGHETQEIGCNNTIIENNTVFNNDIGITPRFGKNYNLTIRNNNVSDNNGFNILIRSIDNVKIENNIIENRNCLFLADFGLSTGNITNVIILNNKLSGCWNGIYLGTENNQDYIINVSIINNSITNGTNGIYVSSDRIINPQLLSNYICFNDNYDIINYNDLTGNNNTCDKTYNYNDIDKEEGCTYPCPIAVECTCNSCEDCTNKLNNENCTKVKLINDIINIDRNPCINISFSNKIFDCQNYSIIGNETLKDYVAILINPASNVTIKNCNIERFYNAILLGIGSRSPKNYNFINIINNTLLNNSIAITYSEEIEIYNSQIENNTLIDNIFGIKFKGSNNIIRNNKIRGKYRSNATRMETIGIMIYQPSRSTLIDNNIVCKHVYDIKADTYASGIQNYCDVAINFSDSNASGCKKKTDINFDIKSYLLKSDKIPIIKFDVILYSNISAKARLYSKYNWKEEWKPNFGASSCILLLGGSLQRSSEKLTLQESTSKESIITFKLIQESVGEESISLSPLEQKPSLPPPEPLPPKPPYKPPIFTLCSSSGELVSVYSGDEIFAEGYGIVSPTEPCMEGRESYNITFLDAFPYKDCSNKTIMKFEYYKIEFENFCNKKESDVYLRKTNELIKSPSKQTGINFVSFTTDIRYGGIAVASDGKMAIVTPEDIDCTIQLPIELKRESPWITLSSSSELLTSCISRKLQEENSSARLIYASYWDEERQMYIGHPASLFANAYIKDFPIKLGKSYFVDVNKNLTFTQFGKLPPESIWHEIKAVGEKINIITLTPHQQNITTVRQLCNLSFINQSRYIEYWDSINQDFKMFEIQPCRLSSNKTLDLSIPYRVRVIGNYSGLIP